MKCFTAFAFAGFYTRRCEENVQIGGILAGGYFCRSAI